MSLEKDQRTEWRIYLEKLTQKLLNISMMGHASSRTTYSRRIQVLCYNIEGLKKLMNQTIDDSKVLRQRVDILLVHSHEVVDRLYYTEKRIHQLNNCVKNEDFSTLCDVQ